MSLGEIIKRYREEHSLSMDDFSKLSGISKAYISLLEKKVNPRNNKPIAPSIQCIKQAADGMHMDFDVLFNMLEGNVSIIENTIETVPIESGCKIPVLGRVCAGNGTEAIEEQIDIIEISPKMAQKGEHFGLVIKGDSMTPLLSDGDIVIVNRDADAESGDLIVALVNGSDAMCKRLQKYSEGFALIPENPLYEPMRYTKEDIDELPVKIIGKVVESRRKY